MDTKIKKKRIRVGKPENAEKEYMYKIRWTIEAERRRRYTEECKLYARSCKKILRHKQNTMVMK